MFGSLLLYLSTFPTSYHNIILAIVPCHLTLSIHSELRVDNAGSSFLPNKHNLPASLALHYIDRIHFKVMARDIKVISEYSLYKIMAFLLWYFCAFILILLYMHSTVYCSNLLHPLFFLVLPCVYHFLSHGSHFFNAMNHKYKCTYTYIYLSLEFMCE